MDEKRERETKVEENFKKWLQKKNQELNQIKAKQLACELELKRQNEEKVRKMEAAIAEWNCEKNKELKKKMKSEVEKKAKERDKKEKEEQEKNEHASLAYQAWMRNVTEKDHKRREKEWKKASIVEKKQIQTQERRSEAEMSFAVWKKKKDQELLSQKRKMRKTRERGDREMREKIEARSYEAEQSYLNWLDSLDYF